jgi:hypothetical protein
LATSGDFSLATNGDFLMAMDTWFALSPIAIATLPISAKHARTSAGSRPQTHSSCPGYRLRKLSSGIREEIDDAIATELGHPESLSKAVELKDIGWALAGIAVDAVGIVVQLCA